MRKVLKCLLPSLPIRCPMSTLDVIHHSFHISPLPHRQLQIITAITLRSKTITTRMPPSSSPQTTCPDYISLLTRDVGQLQTAYTTLENTLRGVWLRNDYLIDQHLDLSPCFKEQQRVIQKLSVQVDSMKTTRKENEKERGHPIEPMSPRSNDSSQSLGKDI